MDRWLPVGWTVGAVTVVDGWRVLPAVLELPIQHWLVVRYQVVWSLLRVQTLTRLRSRFRCRQVLVPGG